MGFRPSQGSSALEYAATVMLTDDCNTTGMTAVQVALSFNLLPLHTLQRLALVPFDDIIREGIIGDRKSVV